MQNGNFGAIYSPTRLNHEESVWGASVLLSDIPLPESQPTIGGERGVYLEDNASDARRVTPRMRVAAW